MKRIAITIITCTFLLHCHGQSGEGPNTANSSSLPANAAQASKSGSMPVNLFTGTPGVSVPIYSFKNNSGLSMSVSIDYSGGGIQVNEQPSIVGLGWNLSAGGAITRTVRGMPDDMPTYGWLYAAAIPSDWRTNASKYYHDSIDAQQDIFQFSFNGHSGRFYLGRDSQVIVVPYSKIRVIPAFQTAGGSNQCLKSFRIVAEDGVKYDFEDANQTVVSTPQYSQTGSGYYGAYHTTSWGLTRIISAFSTDTIKFNYVNSGGAYNYTLPQITFVNSTSGLRKTPYTVYGQGSNTGRNLSSIQLPDKTTVSFVYSMSVLANVGEFALSKIKISDTAFRFGYLLDYDSTYTFTSSDYGHPPVPHVLPIKLQLKKITPFTKTEKQNGYSFTYYQPFYPKPGSYGDSLFNKIDHWGYYNGAVNGDSLLPRINSYTWGANREPDPGYSQANMLSTFKLPTGGYFFYIYEGNDHYPYTRSDTSISASLHTSTSNNIILNQVFNDRHQLAFLLDKSVVRTGSSPVTGAGIMNIAIKSTDGSVTYLSTTLSLNDLYYSGLRTWTFNLPNGTYRLETALASGTSIGVSFPATVNWEIKRPSNAVNFQFGAGIRIKSVQPFIGYGPSGPKEEYHYVLSNGKSSGFLGDVPRYDYPYRDVVINGSTTTTDYTAVCSQLLGNVGFAQGGIAGYSRIEVIKTDGTHNLGKEVHEFTDLRDINAGAFAPVFPYTPQDIRNWGIGMPKKIILYDSAGNIVKKTVNNYQYDTIVYNNDNFKGIKIGHSKTTYFGSLCCNPPKLKEFIGEEYYLTNGRIYLSSSYDTLYHTNASTSTSYQHIFYDTNYNVNRAVSSYDRNRGLQREERIYYPYNYTVSGGIGKLRDSAIISQMVATESWIIDTSNTSNNRLLSAAMTSFRGVTSGDVKPDTIYSFVSNKPITAGIIGAFNPAQLNRNATYFKPQTYFTSFDSKGNLSEMKSLVTGLSNAVIVDYDQQYATAKVSNAVQADVAYTSFESTSNGNWTIGSTTRDATQSLTGRKSYNVSNGSISKTSLSSGKNYLLTLWVKSGASITVNGSSLSGSIANQNNWYFYSLPLSGITSITISGSGNIDEVRLHPKEANMESYTYEPLIGVTSATDPNNTVVYTEYDNLNRVKLLRDKDRNIIKRFDYSDTTMFVNLNPSWQLQYVDTCNSLGQIDSVFKDINIFSDSSGYVKTKHTYVLNCNCPIIVSDPKYKKINGVCEMGVWRVTSSFQPPKSTMWTCVYRWCFSDGSYSTYSETYYEYFYCPVTCVAD